MEVLGIQEILGKPSRDPVSTGDHRNPGNLGRPGRDPVGTGGLGSLES